MTERSRTASGGEIEAAHRRPAIVGSRALRGPVFSQSDVIAFVQLVRSERNDAISRLEVADNRSSLVAQAGDLHGMPRDPRRFAFDQPYAGTLARIEDRA